MKESFFSVNEARQDAGFFVSDVWTTNSRIVSSALGAIAEADAHFFVADAAMLELHELTAGNSSSRAKLPNDDLLSDKQREIIEAFRQGLDASSVAKKLRIPSRALRFHVRRICELTQAESIAEAVQLLSQLSFSKSRSTIIFYLNILVIFLYCWGPLNKTLYFSVDFF